MLSSLNPYGFIPPPRRSCTSLCLLSKRISAFSHPETTVPELLIYIRWYMKVLCDQCGFLRKAFAPVTPGISALLHSSTTEFPHLASDVFFHQGNETSASQILKPEPKPCQDVGRSRLESPWGWTQHRWTSTRPRTNLQTRQLLYHRFGNRQNLPEAGPNSPNPSTSITHGAI